MTHPREVLLRKLLRVATGSGALSVVRHAASGFLPQPVTALGVSRCKAVGARQAGLVWLDLGTAAPAPWEECVTIISPRPDLRATYFMSPEQREEQLRIPLSVPPPTGSADSVSAQEAFRVPDRLSDRAIGGMSVRCCRRSAGCAKR